MAFYYTIIILLALGVFFELSFLSPKRKHLFLYCFFAGLLTLICAFRYQVGGDWKNYMLFFEDQTAFRYEKGYLLLNKVVRLFTDDYYVFQFLCSCIPCCIIFRTLYKYNKFPLFILLIYVSNYYIWCNFEQVRQLIAYSIVALGFVFVERKHFFCWAISILLACQFHITAIVAFPLYYSSRIILSTNTSFTILVIICLLNVIPSNFLKQCLQCFLSMVGSEFLFMKSKDYLENLTDENKNSLWGTAVRSVFYLVLLVLYKYRQDKTKHYYVCNFLIGFMFASLANTLEILNRFSIFYMVPGNGLCAFELFITSLEEKPLLNLLRKICVVLFIVFLIAAFIRSILILPEDIYFRLVPYKSIFGVKI